MASLASAAGGSPAFAQTGTGAATAPSSAAVRASEDKSLMADLVHANLAEIETGRLALEKTQNPQVRKFAQLMIDDHNTALNELRLIAANKNIALPESTDLQHKALATALKLLSGDTFDRQYIARSGVNDHERTLQLLEKAQNEGRDMEFKAYASKMVPIVREHLTMARQLDNRKK